MGKLTIVRHHGEEKKHKEKTNLESNMNSKYKLNFHKNSSGFLNKYLKGHKTSFKQTDRDDEPTEVYPKSYQIKQPRPYDRLLMVKCLSSSHTGQI